MPVAPLWRNAVRVCDAHLQQMRCRVLSRPPWGLRKLGTGDKGDSGNGACKESSESPFRGSQHLPRGPTMGRQSSRWRSLSPLERISRLLPQEALSQEVWNLRDSTAESRGPRQGVKNGEEAPNASETGQEEKRSIEMPPHGETVTAQGYAEGWLSPEPPTDKPFVFGELVLAEYHGKFRQEFRKMFQLQEKGCLQSPWGILTHKSIMGHISGTVMRFSGGASVLVRRPSLEEYVLLMRRAPAIAYPKDVSAILMMMDVTEGDSILESGSGSGAMTLFLSRAVGSRGVVLSVELREDHHLRAVRNYQRWRTAWSLRRGDDWPDNVRFHHADLQDAAKLLSGRSFNSIALDMLNPQLVLAHVFPHLHTGGVCVVYQANLTQVIDLLEGIRVSGLPLHCERIVEVQHKDWLVAPAIKKDGRSAARVEPHRGADEEKDDEGERHQPRDEEMGNGSFPPFGTVPYIARPHHHQTAHTGECLVYHTDILCPSST
ncbi:tRNA (adenine(58)-N(1))-methyltransferase, mitochondrial [Arapaima gigas]